MSVFSKCVGTNCPRKELCYRYLVEAAPKNQPWLCMEVSVKQVDSCKFFIDNQEKLNE
jgi:hypothetical protein